MYYHICPHCRASLDPGETCDCTKRKAVSAATEHGKDCACTQNLQVYCTRTFTKCQIHLKGV